VFLKKSVFFQCVYLVDIVVRDFYRRKARFQLTYVLRSLKYNFLLMFSFFTQEIVPIISIISLYHCAAWLEREVWDLFGIYFFYHKDLRRLLTDYNFQQFPLRKDFPLTGFFDLFYNDNKKVINFLPISLAQEYRFFILQNVW